MNEKNCILASEDGSENIFADLGLDDAEEYNAKVELALTIRRLVKERGGTQKAAAMRVGVKQSDLSNIINGRLDGISMERLTAVLNNLDQDVILQVQPKRGRHGRTSVSSDNAPVIAPLSAARHEG